MKLKEFGPPGGGVRPKFYYVDPPLEKKVRWTRLETVGTGLLKVTSLAPAKI